VPKCDFGAASEQKKYDFGAVRSRKNMILEQFGAEKI